MPTKDLDPISIILISIFFVLLTYAGYISYKSIDWTVLKRLESQPLILPSPPSSSSATVLSPTPSSVPTTKK